MAPVIADGVYIGSGAIVLILIVILIILVLR
jgi:serine acetyltransferase